MVMKDNGDSADHMATFAAEINRGEIGTQANIAASARLTPDWTLPELLGNAFLFNPRASFSNQGWIMLEQDGFDFLTGTALAFAGDMPVLCSRSMVDPRALRLLEQSGLALGHHFVVYDDAASYQALLRNDKHRFVVQHVHPADEIRPEQYWIERALLGYLNNKNNLGRLVSSACVPARRLTTPKKLAGRHPVKFPVVVKVASDETSGGGGGVRICRDQGALDEALIAFGAARQLIVERFLSIQRNLCIQFAVLPNGSAVYLGTSEQIIDQRGKYLGNWIDPTVVPSAAARLACTLVIERAARAGYRGMAGFDTAELSDGRVFIFDLNFRMNGSTLTLLFSRSLREKFGARVLRCRSWCYTGSYQRMLAQVERWNGEGKLAPFSLQRPLSDSNPPRISGVLLGTTRTEVTALEQQWQELGFA